MRRGLSTALLVIATWLLAVPFFTPDLESMLPACCRRSGKHRCCCQMAERLRDGDGFASVREKCPCHPVGLAAAHSNSFKPEAAAQFRIALQVFQARLASRIAFYRPTDLRSSPKRGPPLPLA